MSDKEPVRLSQLALSQARELQKTPENQAKSLRLYLDGKGCDGFYYGITFDAPSSADLRFAHEDIKIIVDPETYEFIHGSIIDWVDDERGCGFLVNNPNHRKFRGKFFKRPNWRDR